MIKLNEKKDFYIILMFLISFILITSGITYGTYSKYYSQTRIDNNLQVAKWVFNLNGESNTTIDINLVDTVDTTNKYSSSAVIPGSSGVIELNIDATGVEVALDYSITINQTNTNLPNNLKLYTDESYTTEFDSFKGFIGLSDSKVKVHKIYWKWYYTTDDETETWSNKSIKLSFDASAVQRIDGDTNV